MFSENKLIQFSVAATVGAVLALSLAVVAFDLAQLPRLWAYIFLGVIVIVVLVNLALLIWGNRLIAVIFGVQPREFEAVLAEAADDVESGNYRDLIRMKIPEALSSFAAFRARMISAFLLLALLGELVLVVQVAALIEQTNAIKTQTERFTQQTTRDLFWQLHNDVEHTNQVRAFRELLIIGQIDFSDFRFPNVDLSGMNLPNVRFRGADLSRSIFVGTTMFNASIERSSFRDSDFSRARLQGRFSGSNFAGSDFTDAELSGNFERADFSSVDLTGEILKGASFNGTNFTGATVSAKTLSEAQYLQTAIGIPQNVMIEVKRLNPELLQFWEPN